MYANHNPTIANAMRNDVDTFIRGATFAVLSIRQPIFLVGVQMLDVDEFRSESQWLFGHKRNAYRYLQENGTRLHASLIACNNDPASAIATLVETPGLSIVKSAFVAQLMGFDVGCIDSRNVARLGLKPREFETWHDSPARRAKRIDAYCERYAGQAQALWDAWCIDVAQAYSGRYASAEAVSAEHLVILPEDFIPF